MKYNCLCLLLLILSLFNFISCEDNVTDSALEKKEVSNKLLDYLSSLTELKEISKSQLDEIFFTIYDLLLENSGKEKNTTVLEEMSKLSERLFEKYADKEKNVIIVEELMKNFNPKSIREFISNFFQAFDLEQFFQSFIIALIKILSNFFINLFTNTDL